MSGVNMLIHVGHMSCIYEMQLLLRQHISIVNSNVIQIDNRHHELYYSLKMCHICKVSKSWGSHNHKD